MQLDLSGHHVEVTAALRGYVVRNLSESPGISNNSLTSTAYSRSKKMTHKAEATLMVRGNKIYADATEENMYASIDALADKLDRCVKKHKEKNCDHRAEDVLKAR